MIEIAASSRRCFVFPAELRLAYAYYGDVERILTYLPHISLVRAHGPDSFRLLYSATELGSYHVRIVADVQARLDEGWRIWVQPLDGMPAIEAYAGLGSSETQGYFRSCSAFYEQGGETRIEYSLELQAELPIPVGLRFMPRAMMGRIVQSITKTRIREIVDGFVERSVAAFPHWLAELGDSGEFKALA
jgi:hypothetical protein